ncbi:MAG: hydroxymethylglutaryl-CoA lyase [Deltaproteobacteria bacterium]|nr:MAG: hydroxymethylglutaryl-CoA lyase [Deltaproteobacteria bacterium]
MSSYPQKVKIVEVGPRDGLQNEKEIIPSEDKIRFIDALSESGLSVIEVSSFVHPKWVPQLSDVSEVYSKIQKKKGVQYPCLVPNLKGLERAIGLGVKEIAVFTAASDGFNQKNINMTVAESLIGIREIIQKAQQEKISVRGYVSTVVACPYEGKIAPEKVLPVVQSLLDAGVDEVSLGDTIGAAVPTDVEKLLSLLLKTQEVAKLAVHFHDTRGTALANILKSLEMGISIIDSSAGGLGGCPYAPGASGNVATEDVLYMLHGMGIQTGVDLDQVVAASRLIEKSLKRTLSSKYLACQSL